MPRHKADLVDIALNLHTTTAMAIAVSETGAPPYIWLPKSQIEYVDTGLGTVEVTMPEWLALEKGLI